MEIFEHWRHAAIGASATGRAAVGFVRLLSAYSCSSRLADSSGESSRRARTDQARQSPDIRRLGARTTTREHVAESSLGVRSSRNRKRASVEHDRWTVMSRLFQFPFRQEAPLGASAIMTEASRSWSFLPAPLPRTCNHVCRSFKACGGSCPARLHGPARLLALRRTGSSDETYPDFLRALVATGAHQLSPHKPIISQVEMSGVPSGDEANGLVLADDAEHAVCLKPPSSGQLASSARQDSPAADENQQIQHYSRNSSGPRLREGVASRSTGAAVRQVALRISRDSRQSAYIASAHDNAISSDEHLR